MKEARGEFNVGFGYRFRGLLLSAAALATAFSGTVRAESLGQALLEAYRQNPTLNAARAGQRATDENVPQALSGWRPTVNAQASVGQVFANTALPATNIYSSTTVENLTIRLNQPLFRGFRTVEGTAKAEAAVKAGREQLLATEQSVLFNGVKAYLDVLQNREILAIRQRGLGVFEGQARGTGERFKAGELTKTDLAQANAQVSGARAQLAAATANLKASEAAFQQVIGHKPGKLDRAPMAKVPSGLDRALSIAHETNPNILAAAQASDAAGHNVGVVRSALLPQADLQGVYSLSGTQGYSSNVGNPLPSTSDSLTVQGVVTVPIYEGGLVYSQVRQAKQLASQSKLNVIDAVRQVRQSVATAWASYTAAQQSVAANGASVAASQLALSGMRQEYQVGSRSTLDVLTAEQSLLTAEVAQVQARHDQVLASYQVQAAIGHLTGQHLRLMPVYDVKDNYNNVRNKWIGLEADTLQ
jgi:outer membrane protein